MIKACLRVILSISDAVKIVNVARKIPVKNSKYFFIGRSYAEVMALYLSWPAVSQI